LGTLRHAAHQSHYQRQVRLADTLAQLSRGRATEACVRVLAIQRVVAAARPHFLAQAEFARRKLSTIMASYDRVGSIPSLFTLMGLSWRERPYNRVLGWICDPQADHGAGRAVLCSLARRLGPSALLEDLADPQAHIQVRCEQCWPSVVRDARMPDLLVLSPNAVLLIENKVVSGQSGVGQYTDYLSTLQRLASCGQRESAAWLAAPNRRATPDGWDGTITHSDLARCIAEAAKGPEVPEWGRVACLLVAEQLRHDHKPGVWLAEARRLLACHAEPPPVTRMLTLARRLGHPIAPSPRESSP